MREIRVGSRARLVAALLAIWIISSLASVRSAVNTNDRYRPLRGGIQIQTTQATATLGYPAYFPVNSTHTAWGVVSASHFADDGERVYQPTVAADNYIGDVIIDGRLRNDGTIDPTWAVDALFVCTEIQETGTRPATVIYYVLSNRSITGYDILDDYITTDTQVRVGDSVTKVGRTTGTTSGEVITPVGFHWMVGWIFNTTLTAAPGDSGAPVFRLTYIPKPDYPGYALVYGIVCCAFYDEAGNLIAVGAVPVNRILDELGVTPYVY